MDSPSETSAQQCISLHYSKPFPNAEFFHAVRSLQTLVTTADRLVLSAAVSGSSSSSSSGAEVTFIVRLKGRSEVDTIARNFKRDRETADAAYSDLVEDIPILKDFRLVGASYSGEINLVYQLPAGVEATRGRIEEIRQQILSIDGVAYADPDFVAHPGEDKRK